MEYEDCPNFLFFEGQMHLDPFILFIFCYSFVETIFKLKLKKIQNLRQLNIQFGTNHHLSSRHIMPLKVHGYFVCTHKSVENLISFFGT